MVRNQATDDSRSRHGCAACLEQHRKCDEGRPRCQLCKRRNIDCDYTRNLRWLEPQRLQVTSRSIIKKPRSPLVNSATTTVASDIKPTSTRELYKITIGNSHESDSTGTESESDSEASLFETTFRESQLTALREKRSLGDGHFGNLICSSFKSPGEINAFRFYFNYVSGVLPAYDGAQNPYRKLATIALTSPVLMDTIISISIGYMYYRGRVPATMALYVQSRALASLRKAIVSSQTLAALRKDCSEPELNDNLFAARQEVFAAVLLQIVHEILTGTCGVDLHLRVAVNFLYELGYIWKPVTSALERWFVQRVVIIDIISSIYWHHRPYLPLFFWFFKPNTAFDESEPSFREMTGCPHQILCFLARISHLVADREDGINDSEYMQKACDLETELRLYASSHSSYDNDNARHESRKETDKYLEMLNECYALSANILLQRRVFRDSSNSHRVQHVLAKLLHLIESIPVGCGPDSSLSLPLYVVAHEAINEQDRSRIRIRNQRLAKEYPNGTRNVMMNFNEELWRRKNSCTSSSGISQEDVEKEVMTLETQKRFFIC